LDTVTQILIGAAAGQAAQGRPLGRKAALLGGVAGLLPDLDVFLSSASDPMVALETHRGFTHALAFVPFGAAVAVVPFLALRSVRGRARASYLAALAGYATHAPLDAFTSYGTQLLWPFSSARVALPAVSIVDPIFTLALGVGLAVALWRAVPAPAAAALVFCLGWLGLGLAQNVRATDVQARLAEARGHAVAHARVDPTLGNQLLWRSVYRDGEGRLHADAIRLPLPGAATVRTGTSAPALRAEDVTALAPGDPRVARAARIWFWFADGLVAPGPVAGSFGDARYAADPAGFAALWALRIRPDDPAGPVARIGGGARSLTVAQLWAEVLGNDARHAPVGEAIAEARARRGPLALRRSGERAAAAEPRRGALVHAQEAVLAPAALDGADTAPLVEEDRHAGAAPLRARAHRVQQPGDRGRRDGIVDADELPAVAGLRGGRQQGHGSPP
jgi:inner membrane protein